MEKLVLITGIDAFEELKSINLSSLSNQFEITYEQAPVKIAAFIGIEHLNGILDKYSNESLNHWFIVSGLIPWDLNLIEGKFTGRVRKGPKFLSNLKETLTKIHPSQLSSLNPADKLIKYDTRNEFNHHIARVKEQISAQIASGQERDGFSISPRFPNVIFSELLPPLIVAEIVDAPQYSDEEIVEKVRYFLDSGADVIDLGCMANKDHSVRITELVQLIRDNFDCPISIDSLNVNEIKAAVDAGVDLVLSITADNLSSLKDIPKDISLVVVPVEDSKKETTVNGRMAKVVMIGNRLNVAGYKKILLDPVLDPAFKPGLSESLETYFLYTSPDAIHSIPLRFNTHDVYGNWNVTELTELPTRIHIGIYAYLFNPCHYKSGGNGVASIFDNRILNKGHKGVQLKNYVIMAIDLGTIGGQKIKNQAPINLGIII